MMEGSTNSNGCPSDTPNHCAMEPAELHRNRPSCGWPRGPMQGVPRSDAVVCHVLERNVWRMLNNLDQNNGDASGFC